VDARAEPMPERWQTLVRQPSISAQDVGVKDCAELLAEMMREDDIETDILPTAGQPNRSSRRMPDVFIQTRSMIREPNR
jgi:hypothetical protein